MDPSLSDLESVWRSHDRPAAEPRRSLSVDRIVAAAVEVADAEGLSAVSMGRVAREVGFTTMALYRHVASKDELILRMCDVAVGPPDLPSVLDGWRSDLEQWAWGSVTRLREHPWVIEVYPASGPPATPNQVAWLDRGLRTLRGVPLTEGEKVWTLLAITVLTIGDVLYAVADARSTARYDAPPAPMLDDARFPDVARAFAGGGFTMPDDGDARTVRDAQFGFTLARTLDGVERLVAERRQSVTGAD